MHPKPFGVSCNECNRVCNHENDFEWLEIKRDEGFWYPICRYCRARRTRRYNKRENY